MFGCAWACALATQATLSTPLVDPLDLRNHRPVALAFLRIPHLGQALANGQREMSISVIGANDIRKDALTLEDAEMWRINARLRKGTAAGEWFVELPIIVRGGGWLDPIIDGWHKTVLRATYALRENTKMFGSRIYTAGSHDFGSAFGIGDLTLGGAKNLGPHWTLRAAIKLPTGNASKLLGSGAPDLGIAANYSATLGKKWSVYAQFGFVAQGRATKMKGTNSVVDQETLAIMYSPSSKNVWILQWDAERAPLSTSSSVVSGAHRTLSLGYRHKISANGTLDLFFSEDADIVDGRQPWIANIGPDFTAGLRYVWRF